MGIFLKKHFSGQDSGQEYIKKIMKISQKNNSKKN
jgi:hypothetical protein